MRFDPTNPSGSSSDPVFAAARFAKLFIEYIETVHRQAVAADVAEPIVALFDLDDRASRRAARELMDSRRFEALLSAGDGGSKPGAIHGAAVAMPFAELQTWLAERLEPGAARLERPNTPERIRCCVFTAGDCCAINAERLADWTPAK